MNQVWTKLLYTYTYIKIWQEQIGKEIKRYFNKDRDKTTKQGQG